MLKLKNTLSRHAQALLLSGQAFLRLPLTHVMTMMVVALTLALPILLQTLMNNVYFLTADWKQSARISMYLKSSVSEKDIQLLMGTLRNDPHVSELVFKSPAQGMEELSREEGMENIMLHLRENPLPAVIEVILSPKTNDAMDSFYQTLKQMPEVEEIRYDTDWIQQLQAIFSFASSLAYALMILLSIAVIFIISNTFRLTILNRKEEIQILKMVGATDAFIIRPFLYMGLAYGIIAAMLAWLLISILTVGFGKAVNMLAEAYKMHYSIIGLSRSQILHLFLFAGILGWLAAFLSVKRQLRLFGE